MPVAQFFTLLPLDTTVNRVPFLKFLIEGGSKDSKGVPEQQGISQ